ncbi:glycerate kinase [Candidatus Bathyarchaeota archaeon]|nr:glycerate kinase [Candidatus Bathyarchaeota archaeon]
MKIKNSGELVSHGNVTGRKLILDIIEYALEAMDPRRRVRKLLSIDDGRLKVGELEYELSGIGDIYVLGAGKGSVFIAEALEEILGDRIKDGIVVEKRGQGKKLRRIKVLEASHPLPDRDGYEAACSVVDLAKEATERDIVFFCLAGGASALLPLPADDITLEDKIKVTDMLLKCGARIDEINAVRKHISAIKGGRLAKYIHPAEIINLIIVDEVAGLPWGPTVPDKTTFQDAVYTLKKYGLYDKIPSSIKNYLERGLRDESLETPKQSDFREIKLHNFILGNAEMVCEAADEKAKELGLNSMILSTMIEGESKEVGTVLAGIAKEIAKNRRPVNPPCAVISGGETTVTITGEPGEGGRNQELALSFSLMVDGSKRIVAASVATDGTDGPTDIAGGIVDGYTVKRAEELGIDIAEHIAKHDSSHVLKKLNDAVYTGPTGTNVMDLRVFIVI